MGVGQQAGVEVGHDLVLGAVHDQQWPRGEVHRVVDGPDVLQLARPRVHRRRPGRVVDDADLAGVGQQTSGSTCPVLEVGRRRDGGHPRDAGIPGTGADPERPTRAESGAPDAVHPLIVEQVVDRRVEVVQPALEGELSLRRPAATEVERQDHPAELGGDPVGQLGVGVGRLRATRPALGEAVEQGQPRHPGAVAVRGSGEVGGQGQLARAEAVVQLSPGGTRGCGPRRACPARSRGRSRPP